MQQRQHHGHEADEHKRGHQQHSSQSKAAPAAHHGAPKGPKKSSNTAMWAFAIAALLAVVGILVVIAVLTTTKNSGGTEKNVTTQYPTLKPSQDGNTVVTPKERTITSLVESVSPSVVSITAGSQYSGASAGTGFIVSKDGYIVTNSHVVKDFNTVSIMTSDGQRYKNVKVVGADPLNDIAFLKVPNVDNLRPVQVGDSSTLRVGQGVVAIGNSLGQYQNTVTSGIISGKGRPIVAANENGRDISNLTDLIQTDAAINPGNSGGPLLNMSGQVIGINTAVASDAQGIGFAIPINASKGILKQVLAGKGVNRAYIGVRYVMLTKTSAEEYGTSVSSGAYILSQTGRGSGVEPGGPADKAGLRAGDVIVKINGEEVGKDAGFSSVIAQYAPGETIQVTIVRDKAEKVVPVTLVRYRDR